MTNQIPLDDRDPLTRLIFDPVYGQVGVYPPPNDAALWRFMSFAKFLSLLETQTLYLARVDCFEDRFEGAFPKEMQEMWDQFASLLTDALTDAKREWISDGFDTAPTPFWQKLRERTFINCWHMSPHESDAMWKLYGHVQEAIGVRTTAIDLLHSIRHPTSSLFVGQVFYIDFDSKDMGFSMFPSLVSPFFFKRKAFEHEKEVRILYQPHAELGVEHHNPFGRSLHIDLESLVKEVVLAPTTPKWLLELIRTIIRRYGLKPTLVTRSSLDGDPIFPA